MKNILQYVSKTVFTGSTILTCNVGYCYIPEIAKSFRGGEDALFIHQETKTSTCFGVADGVGGWGSKGIDSGIFSRKLMSLCSSSAKTEDRLSSSFLVKLLKSSHDSIIQEQVMGSSTALLCNIQNNILDVISLGDSSLVIIRNNEVVFRTFSIQHFFNCPLQLSCLAASDSPEASCCYSVNLAKNDWVIAGTDGLFDNLHESDIIRILKEAECANMEVPRVSVQLATEAMRVSFNNRAKTPFSMGYEEHYGEPDLGGKRDDITVIAARMQ